MTGDGSASEDEATAEALRSLLVDAGVDIERVSIDGVVTAGANRRTLLVSGRPGPVALVAQIADRDREQSWLATAADEAAMLRTAAAAGVPVPHVVAAGYCATIDADALVTGVVEGETIPRRVLRSLDRGDMTADNAARMARSCGAALAALHAIDPAASITTSALEQYDPAGYVDHLHDRLNDLPTPHPTFRFALDVLGDHPPASPERPCVVHGDFRNGNLIVADAEVQAVLDWELVHRGDAMEDLAWLCLRTWRFGNDDLEAGGFTTLEQLRAAYVESGGRWRQEAFEWWTIARTVWWGVGLAAQAARFVDGTSTSIVHAASGRRVVELEYDLINLLEPMIN